MPVFNAAQYLSESIESVLNQDGDDFKFLIINDGSIDKSSEIIQSFDDNRILYLENEKNLGLVPTLNRGLSEVTTPYMIRMDADDISCQGRLRKLIEYMEARPDTGVCSSYLELFGNVNEKWDKAPLTDEALKAKLLFESSIPHAPSIIRMDVLRKHGIEYRFDFPHMEDYDLWLRLKDHTRFAVIPEILYKYRITGENVTLKNNATVLKRKKRIYSRILKTLGIEPTEYQLLLHIGFELNQLKISSKVVEDYYNWLWLLQERNNEKAVFPESELKKIIDEKWENFFYYIPPKGIKAVYTYKRLGNLSRKQGVYFIKNSISHLFS